MMTSESNNEKPEDSPYDGPSKSQQKRDSKNLTDLGEEIIRLSHEDIRSLNLPDELGDAITTALKIKSRSGLKRQRLYIGKLLRSIDSDDIENQVRNIQHRHDTNTAHFKRLEKWRDKLIDNDKTTLNEVISHFPEIDRQHLNQLIRVAHQENLKNKPPAASRKLFKYLRELEDNRIVNSEF